MAKTSFPKISVVKFIADPSQTVEEILKETMVGKLVSKYNETGQLTREEKNRLACWANDSLHRGIYKIHGYNINLCDIMKVYVVKQYGSWYEYYGIDKTSVRYVIKHRGGGPITKIVEVV